MEYVRAERGYERHAWLIFFVLGLLCLGFGIHSLLLPWFDPTHWDWLSEDRAVYRYLSVHFRWMGLSAIGFALLTLVIAVRAYRRGERWAWYAFWYWPIYWLLAMAFAEEELEYGIPVLVLSLLGLLLPYRRFFKSSAGHATQSPSSGTFARLGSVAAVLALSWLGILFHDFRHFGGPSPQASIPALAIALVLLFAWWRFPQRQRVVRIISVTFGVVWLLAAVLSIMPLRIWWFVPEQTLSHYTTHMVWSATQLPLIWLMVSQIHGAASEH